MALREAAAKAAVKAAAASSKASKAPKASLSKAVSKRASSKAASKAESLHRLAERVKVYAAASDPVHPNDVEKFAANKQIKLIEADGGHFGPKTYVPMLHRRKSRSPRRADKAPRPLHKKILSQMLQPYWVAHVVWVLCCAMLCQSQWGMLSSLGTP